MISEKQVLGFFVGKESLPKKTVKPYSVYLGIKRISLSLSQSALRWAIKYFGFSHGI